MCLHTLSLNQYEFYSQRTAPGRRRARARGPSRGARVSRQTSATGALDARAGTNPPWELRVHSQNELKQHGACPQRVEQSS